MTEPNDLRKEIDEPTPHYDDSEKAGLMSRSFVALVVTQALVALNDNMFRWLIIPIGKALIGTWLINKSAVENSMIGSQLVGKTPGEIQAIGDNIALFLGAMCFFLPFMVLVAPAGFVADRFSKRTVIIACKVTEVLVMAFGIIAIMTGNSTFMFITMFLMGSQSAFFSPSKYGAIPEIVRHDQISAANGIVAMTTMAAIIIGALFGGYLFAWTSITDVNNPLFGQFGPGQYHWWVSATALIGIALVGWLASLPIGRIRAANPARNIPWNPVSQTVRDMGELFARRALLLAALASAAYWALGAFAQSNIDQYGTQFLHVQQEHIGPMLALLVLGIGIGSIVTGFISRGRIELGLVAPGCFGVIVMLIMLGLVPAPTLAAGESYVAQWSWPYTNACFWLFMLGIMAGCYDIPLVAYLQEKSPAESRGRIIAAYNFLSFFGMSLSALVYFVLRSQFEPNTIWLIAGVGMIPLFFVIVHFTLYPITRMVFRFLVWAMYRPRVVGDENIPKEGGVLLVANHVSWADIPLLALPTERPIRFFAWAGNLNIPGISRMSKELKTIPVEPGARQAVLALRAASRALAEGDVVAIFPEGGVTRTGGTKTFQGGYQSILNGVVKIAKKQNGNGNGNGGNANAVSNGVNGNGDNTIGSDIGDTGSIDGKNGNGISERLPVPIVPVFIGGIWGSIFSHYGGVFLKRFPHRLRQRVTIVYGEPIFEMKSPFELRQIITEMGIDAMRDSLNDPSR